MQDNSQTDSKIEKKCKKSSAYVCTNVRTYLRIIVPLEASHSSQSFLVEK